MAGLQLKGGMKVGETIVKLRAGRCELRTRKVLGTGPVPVLMWYETYFSAHLVSVSVGFIGYYLRNCVLKVGNEDKNYKRSGLSTQP